MRAISSLNAVAQENLNVALSQGNKLADPENILLADVMVNSAIAIVASVDDLEDRLRRVEGKPTS